MMGSFLEVLWRWLYTSYVPVEVGNMSIDKDKLIDELLVAPEGAGKFSERLRPLYKSYVVRYLLAQYPNSPLRTTNFMDAKQTAFLLRAATEGEVATRRQQVPPFPEELRSKLLAQLKEEMMGRRSASSLVSLSQGPQNPPMSPAPAANFEGTLSTPVPAKVAGPKDAPMSPAPMSRTSSEIGAPAKPGNGGSSSRQASPNRTGGPLRDSNVLKRSLTASGAAAVQAAASHLEGGSDASGEVSFVPDAKKLRQTNPASQPPQIIPASSEGAPAEPDPSLGPLAAPPHAQYPVILTAQQFSNMPQDVALLRAWQIAMQKEIIELRTELQKRDRSMHRDMAALRQEIDALRGEMAFQEFKTVQGKGVQAAAAAVMTAPPSRPHSERRG